MTVTNMIKVRKRKMFWGILFLAIGVLIIIQHILKIDLPVLRILFGVFLIYIGLKTLFGSFGVSINRWTIEDRVTDTSVMFDKTEFKTRSQSKDYANSEYSTVFGESRLDLSQLKDEDLSQIYKIENAFGKTRVKTQPERPLEVHIAVGFGSVRVRDQKLNAFGEMTYKSQGTDATLPPLKLQIDCAFGEVIVE